MIQTPLRTRSPARASSCRASAALAPSTVRSASRSRVDPLALAIDLGLAVLAGIEQIADDLVAELRGAAR